MTLGIITPIVLPAPAFTGSGIVLTGIPTDEAFGSLTVGYDQTVTFAGIATTETLGVIEFPNPGLGNLRYWVDGLPQPALDGSGNIKFWADGLPYKNLDTTVAVLSIIVTGIPTDETFGSLVVTHVQAVFFTGIPTGETMGALSVSYPQSVTFTGIATAEAFGNFHISNGAPQTVTFAGIATTETFGNPFVAHVPIHAVVRVAQFFSDVSGNIISHLYLGTDGVDFQEELEWNTGIPQGYETPRDGSLLKYGDYWYIVYTGNPSATPIYRSAGPYDPWVLYANIDWTAISGVQATWAPEFFVDDDGSVHVVVALDTGPIPYGMNHRIYEVHNVNPGDLSSWSTPQLLTSNGPSTSFNQLSVCIDPCLRKYNGVYYCYFTNNNGAIFYVTSTSLLGPYDNAVYVSGNYFGSEPYSEAPCVLYEGGTTWKLYFDRTFYGDALDPGQTRVETSTDNLVTWSGGASATYLTVNGVTPPTLKHGTVIIVPYVIFGNQESIASEAAMGSAGRISSNIFTFGKYTPSARLGFALGGAARLGLDVPLPASSFNIDESSMLGFMALGVTRLGYSDIFAVDGTYTLGNLNPSARLGRMELGSVRLSYIFVAVGPQSAIFTGIPTEEAFGTLSITQFANIQPAGIATTEAMGALSPMYNQFVTFTGVATGEAFGNLMVGKVKYDSLNVSATSAATFAPTKNALEAGYAIWIDAFETGQESPMPTGSFTVGSQVGNSDGGFLGYMECKKGLEILRDPGSKPRPLFAWDSVPQNLAEFSISSRSSLNTTISDTLSFTASGKTGVGTSSSVGQLIQKFGILSSSLAARATQVAVETLGSENPSARASQIAVEVLSVKASKARATQIAVETLKLANYVALQQDAVEALGTGINTGVVQQVAIEVLANSRAAMVVSQVAGEFLAGGDVAKARATQIAVEAIRQRTEPSLARDRIQQSAIEMASSGNPYALVSAMAFEAAHNGTPNALVSVLAAEAVHSGIPKVLINVVAPEAIHDAIPTALVKQVAIEVITHAGFDGTVGSMLNNPRFGA